ncbi:MAG TPA: hypothetical protein V6D10_07375 [Trichocoleus sp.]|jgi:hypothetical protein
MSRYRNIGTPVPGKFRAGDRAITQKQCGQIPIGQPCRVEQSIRMGQGRSAYYLCLVRSGGRSAWAREGDLRRAIERQEK